MSNEVYTSRLRLFKEKLAEMSDDWRVALERETEFMNVFGDEGIFQNSNSVHLVHEWIFPRTFEIDGKRYHNWAIFLTDHNSKEREQLNKLFCDQQYVFRDNDGVQREMNQMTLSTSLEEAIVDETLGNSTEVVDFQTLVRTNKNSTEWNKRINQVIEFLNGIRLTPSFQDFRDEPMEEELVTIGETHRQSLAMSSVYIMYADDRILGAAVVNRSSLKMRAKPPSNSRCIDLLAVGQKNAGHGKLLLNYVIKEEKSRKTSAKRLYAQAVPVISSLGFWFSRGFRVSGEEEKIISGVTSTVKRMLFDAQLYHCRGLLSCNGVRSVDLDVPKRSEMPLFVVRANDKWWARLEEYKESFAGHRLVEVVTQEIEKSGWSITDVQSWYDNDLCKKIEEGTGYIFVVSSDAAEIRAELVSRLVRKCIDAETVDAGEGRIDDGGDATGSSSSQHDSEWEHGTLDLSTLNVSQGVERALGQMKLYQNAGSMYIAKQNIRPVSQMHFIKKKTGALLYFWEQIVCFDHVFDNTIVDPSALSSWEKYCGEKYGIVTFNFSVDMHMEVICGGEARYKELKDMFQTAKVNDVFVLLDDTLLPFRNLMVEHLRCLLPQFCVSRLVTGVVTYVKKSKNYVHDAKFAMSLVKTQHTRLAKRNSQRGKLRVGKFGSDSGNEGSLFSSSILDLAHEERWKRRADDDLVKSLVYHLNGAHMGSDASLLPMILSRRAHDLSIDEIACVVAEMCNELILRQKFFWESDIVGLGNVIVRDLRARTRRKSIVFMDDSLANFEAEIPDPKVQKQYLHEVLEIHVSFLRTSFSNANRSNEHLKQSFNELMNDLGDVAKAQLDCLTKAHGKIWHSDKINEEEVFFDPAAGVRIGDLLKLYEWDEMLPDDTTWIFDWDYTMVKTAGFLNIATMWNEYAEKLKLPMPHDDECKRAHMEILCGGTTRYAELRKFFEKVGGSNVHILTANQSIGLIAELFASLCPTFPTQHVHFAEGEDKKRFIANKFLKKTRKMSSSPSVLPKYADETKLIDFLWNDNSVAQDTKVGEHGLTIRGVRTLKPGEYVNSQVVDCYFETVIARLPKRLRDHIHYWSNASLVVPRPIKRLFQEKNYHVMTNVYGNHWYMCVIDRQDKKVYMHDSLNMEKKDSEFQNAIVQFLARNEWNDDYEFIDVTTDPQENSFDCGVHILLRGSRLMVGANVHTIATTSFVKEQRKQLAVCLSTYCHNEKLARSSSGVLRKLAFGDIDLERWDPGRVRGTAFNPLDQSSRRDGDGGVGGDEDEAGEEETENVGGDEEGHVGGDAASGDVDEEGGSAARDEEEDGEGEEGDDAVSDDEGEEERGNVARDDSEEEEEEGGDEERDEEEDDGDDDNFWSVDNLSSTTATLRNWLRYYMTLHGIYTQQISRTKVAALFASLATVYEAITEGADDDSMMCMVIHKIRRENQAPDAVVAKTSNDLIAVIPYRREGNSVSFYEKNFFVQEGFQTFVQVYLMVRFYRLVRLSGRTIDDEKLPKNYRFKSIGDDERQTRIDAVFNAQFIHDYSGKCNVGSRRNSYDLCRVASSPTVFSVRQLQ